jgi:hypothetical protein
MERAKLVHILGELMPWNETAVLGHIDELQVQLASAQEDVARLDWLEALRDYGFKGWLATQVQRMCAQLVPERRSILVAKSVRAAIDAARTENPPGCASSEERGVAGIVVGESSTAGREGESNE